MKKFWLMMLFLVPIFLFSQSVNKRLIRGTFEDVTPRSAETDEVFLHETTGKMVLQLEVDNVAGSGDSVWVEKMYFVAEKWVSGGNVPFLELPAVADDTLSTSKEYILPQSSDSLATFVWKLDPSNDATIQGDIEKMKFIHHNNGSVSYFILMKAITFLR